MQQAPARDSASVFRKKPVEFAPVAWSGRLNPDELSRPGGLLIAALSQCADERDLSLSELASAMGVSYWSLSQLRIGFRPIESLDDDVVEACAAFLDLPRLTIEMLAGLLAPADALACDDLTGEDILHACRLLATEPGELELLPPPNRQRPLQGFAVDELAAMHREHGAYPAVCEALRAELRQRPMSKTELLRAAVHAGAAEAEVENEAADTTPPHGILRCTCCQKRLRIPHLPEPGEIRCPSCQTEYAVHWQAAICVVQRLEVEAAPDDETDADAEAPETSASAPMDPWAVLGLARNSPWDAVERARRSLLQQYHPDRLGHVSPLVHKLAEEAFKRVGDAYDQLKSQR
ncbi:MAG: hypothetical protein CVU36_09015 [Betaproteobacteria bacterium HGW-Betaproteobacteria-9]|jgi:hypothetical protein|nr:MAG: hypothetical protein CVU36_09015 [Betaproteobacteria bacterium HGW-Betaproteobacteria-9]